MKQNKKQILLYIILILTSIIMILSFIYLFSFFNKDNTIGYQKYRNISNLLKKEIKERNLNFKDKYKINTHNNNNVLNFEDLKENKNMKKIGKTLKSCDILKEGIQKNDCYEKFFSLKYSQFLTKKGIVDIQICKDIKELFGEEDYLYKKCKFVYAVNFGDKFSNINECLTLENTKKIDYAFSKEKCINMVIYSILGNNNMVGSYIKEMKDRNDEEKSPLTKNILNNHGNFIKGELKGIELYDFDLSKFIEKQYSEYNKEIKEK